MNSSDNDKPILNLYLVSFVEDTWDEYDAFVVAAHSKSEAADLTPNKKLEKYLAGIGNKYPVTYSTIKDYIYTMGMVQSVTLIGEARGNVEWGDIIITSYKSS